MMLSTAKYFAIRTSSVRVDIVPRTGATFAAMIAEQIAALQNMLADYIARSSDTESKNHAAQIARFVASEQRPWSRDTLAGHMTASAWVLDRTHTHAAMIHHRKLDRWLQPGGHVEDGDASWWAASQREVSEEIGLTQFLAQDDDSHLFDVDVHAIPARGDVPTHFHYDIRFLFVADIDATGGLALELNADEAHDCRWFSLIELANDPTLEPSIRRMVELSIRQFS